MEASRKTDLGRAAIGTWSGGRFLRYGETIERDLLVSLLRPDDGISTLITADVYGAGEADAVLGDAIDGIARDRFSLVGAVGHDFYEGERDGPRGYPRFTDPGLRGPDAYADYLRTAAERQLERLGTDRLDLLLLHNPDRTGYSSEVVWDGMAALRDAGLTASIGVAPGPANGFTLDLLECFERFGDRIDWAMVILNPFEPWPAGLTLKAAERHGIGLITRVVDYGGIFWDGLRPGAQLAKGDHRAHRPDGWIEAGLEKLDGLRPIAKAHGLTPMQLACAWNLSQPAVECVAPTLIQEAGPDARPIELLRAELAAIPGPIEFSPDELTEIERIGDNTGSMDLKGASPHFEGEETSDRWAMSPALERVGERWGIEPERDLAFTGR